MRGNCFASHYGSAAESIRRGRQAATLESRLYRARRCAFCQTVLHLAIMGQILSAGAAASDAHPASHEESQSIMPDTGHAAHLLGLLH